MSAPKVPPSLKPIAHYIKIANENASRDPVIYYWCLFYAVQTGMVVDKSSPDALKFLTSLLATLEAIKKQLAGNDAITSEVVAQAHIENFAMKLFTYADKKEKAGQIDKSVVQAFYTAGHVMDILSLFGEMDDQYAGAKKYAKWKSTQIFACLKDGTPYVPSSQQHNQEDPESSQNVDTSGFYSNERGYPDASNQFGSSSGSGSLNNQSGVVPSFGLPSVPGTGSTQPPPYGLPTVPPPSAHSAPPTVPPPYATNQPTPVPRNNYPEQSYSEPAIAPSGGKPTFAEFEQARKFTKYAASSIDYEDTKAAVDNLRKALALLEKYA